LIRKRGTLWILLFVFWLVLGVFSAGTTLLELPSIRRMGPPPAGTMSIPTRNFLWQLAVWLGWALLAPVALWLHSKWPLQRSALIKALTVHLSAIVVLCVLHSTIIYLTRLAIMPVSEPIEGSQIVAMLTVWSVRDLPFCALFYGLILGISSAFDYYQRFRERQLRTSQLEAQLAQAQLQMLKMQLHPHFLFNTLNGITGLVRDNDNAGAVQMLVGLSDLLRQTLDNAGKQEVPLSEELEWLSLYLKLQKLRFSDRLGISIHADPDTLDALVPNMIMQPVIENAIRHGLAPRAKQGNLSLDVRRVNQRIELRVSDDGVGLPTGWRLSTGKGLGLLNTEERLRQLYGDAFVLEVRDRISGGVETLITLPYRSERNDDGQLAADDSIGDSVSK